MQTHTWAHTHKHPHGFPKHSEESCLDFGSEDQTPHISKTSLLCSTLPWAEQQGGEIRWGKKEKVRSVKKVTTKVIKTVGAAIPDVYVVNGRSNRRSRNRWRTLSVRQTKPDFFHNSPLLQSRSQLVPWQILKLHAWPWSDKKNYVKRKSPVAEQEKYKSSWNGLTSPWAHRQ